MARKIRVDSSNCVLGHGMITHCSVLSQITGFFVEGIYFQDYFSFSKEAKILKGSGNLLFTKVAVQKWGGNSAVEIAAKKNSNN